MCLAFSASSWGVAGVAGAPLSSCYIHLYSHFLQNRSPGTPVPGRDKAAKLAAQFWSLSPRRASEEPPGTKDVQVGQRKHQDIAGHQLRYRKDLHRKMIAPSYALAIEGMLNHADVLTTTLDVPTSSLHFKRSPHLLVLAGLLNKQA